jgi:hypothetical protein
MVAAVNLKDMDVDALLERALADHAESPPEQGGAIEPLSLAALDRIARLPAGPLTTPDALALVAAASVPVPDSDLVTNLAERTANSLGDNMGSSSASLMIRSRTLSGMRFQTRSAHR